VGLKMLLTSSRQILILVAMVSTASGLTGCSSNGNEMKADLIKACELVNARETTDNFIPDVAIEFFASAARADIKYLPLVEAAKYSQLPPYTLGDETALTSDIIKARSMILGYCTPRKAER
jgi:hypothetical protein